MGGPIDTRRSPTEVNKLAQTKGIEWFERNCIAIVPINYAGYGRKVYPGFLQLDGFMSMNLDRHLTAHWNMFNCLVQGDGDSAEKHRTFYDEYLAVMDLTAEFYLQTVETVFIEHALPRGELMHRHNPVDLTRIRTCALMAVEGEKDDITGYGQTIAALELTPNLPADKKAMYVQPGVGHYGVFNGSKFRAELAPRIKAFMEANA
jgi:poly(3-hydroxybutyrate) depolymerase